MLEEEEAGDGQALLYYQASQVGVGSRDVTWHCTNAACLGYLPVGWT